MVCMLEFMKKSRKTVPEAAGVKPRRLTWKQEKFIDAYIENKGNGTQAYQTVYGPRDPEVAKSGAAEILAYPHVFAALEARRKEIQDAVGFNREKALRILVGMATATLDDFIPVMDAATKRSAYVGLRDKKYALESVKNHFNVDTRTETNELKIISNSERRAALNDLWDKLGLGQGASKGNWFDGLERLADVIREVKGSK